MHSRRAGNQRKRPFAQVLVVAEPGQSKLPCGSDVRTIGEPFGDTSSKRLNLFRKPVNLAGAPGFEPGNVGTKNRCLTAWRRPNSEHVRDVVLAKTKP